VVVDEIHERGINEDFLLIVLRDILPRRPDLKVVLMSATVNAEAFAAYFSPTTPILHIPGFTFPVDELYLEDVLARTRFQIPPPPSNFRPAGAGSGRGDGDEQGVVNARQPHRYQSERDGVVHSSLCNWTGEHYIHELVVGAVEYICEGLDTPANQPSDPLPAEVAQPTLARPPIAQAVGQLGAILVFLPGWDDIQKTHNMMLEHSVLGDRTRFRLLPLHSSLPTHNQREVFERPPPGVRKVVLSTNIAETSVTIDDVVFVVDVGRAKEKTYDAVNDLECLLPAWVSKAAARQRRGRAGRVQPGWCLRLYPRWLHDECFEEYQAPELLRTPLASLVLTIKSLALGHAEPFLSKAMNPPSGLAVHNALELLRDIGALTPAEDLTPLGRHLASLPVEPRIGKMLVYGAVLGCLGPILTIAAALAHRSPFVMPLDKKELADESKARFANGSCSDHLAVYEAYEAWRRARREGGTQGEDRLCWQRFLNKSVLRLLSDMRGQFADLLKDAGFLGDGRREMSAIDRYSNEQCLVRAVLVAGLFPKVAAVQNGKRKAKWHTRDDGKVAGHPSSVNGFETQFEYQWMIYNEKVMSATGIYIRDSTSVSDLALLLFGGATVVEPAGVSGDQQRVSMLDKYISFNAPSRTMELVTALKQELDNQLTWHINHPLEVASKTTFPSLSIPLARCPAVSVLH